MDSRRIQVGSMSGIHQNFAQQMREKATTVRDKVLLDAKTRTLAKATEAAEEGKMSCQVVLGGEEIAQINTFQDWLSSQGFNYASQAVNEGRVAILVKWDA